MSLIGSFSSATTQPTTWFPRETLFSLASRFHVVSGNVFSAQTCLQLFGHASNGAAHDIPSRLGEFATRTNGVFGTAAEIVRHHTLLPFYFPFRLSFDATNAIASVSADHRGDVKARLGILASRFGAAHPLKACTQCIVEDLDEHHCSYWHLDHQWPGAWVCARHDAPLRVGLFKTNGSGRFNWCLPNDVALAESALSRVWETSRDSATKLTECARGLGGLPAGFHFDSRMVVAVYRQRLVQLACASPGGRLHAREFEERLKVACAPLAGIDGMSALAGKVSPLWSQFARLVREQRVTAHPLRHLVMIIALFGDWPSFMCAYRVFSAHHASGVRQRQSQDREDSEQDAEAVDPRMSALVDAVRGGMSVTAAARRFAVAVSTAMSWAASDGIASPRRPKVLVSQLRSRAIRSLQSGASKQDAANACGMSIQTITTLLRTEPGLRMSWNSAKFDFAQRHARETWARTAERLHPPTALALRQLQPAVFAWLYRNDRAWLESFAATLEKAHRSNNSTVRWDERDRQLAQQIRTALLTAYEHGQRRQPTRSQLCNVIPELKARLSDLDRLPLTREALARITVRAKVFPPESISGLASPPERRQE